MFNYLKSKSGQAANYTISDSLESDEDIVAAFSKNARLGQPHLVIRGNYDNEIFRNNLILAESFLPDILGQITAKFDKHRIPIAIAADYLTKSNPLKCEHLVDYNFYEAKLKKLLFELLIGMEADKVWTGQYDTQHGCIVVKKDLKKVHYSIYNANLLQEYLFLNSSIEGDKDGMKIYHK